EGKNIKINTEIAKMYISELKKLAEKENINSNIEVTEISKYPDVLSIQNEQDDEIIRTETLEVVNLAVNQLVNMRQIEGNKIATDLANRIQDIKQKIMEISSLSTGLIKDYVVKLETRIKELLQNQEIDE